MPLLFLRASVLREEEVTKELKTTQHERGQECPVRYDPLLMQFAQNSKNVALQIENPFAETKKVRANEHRGHAVKSAANASGCTA